MRLPITAWASITHRASGVFIFIGIAVFLWVLDASLKSPESFASLTELLSGGLFKFVLWAILSGFIYHSVAGVNHLVADFGIGETLEGGILAARLVIAVAAVLIITAGIWIW